MRTLHACLAIALGWTLLGCAQRTTSADDRDEHTAVRTAQTVTLTEPAAGRHTLGAREEAPLPDAVRQAALAEEPGSRIESATLEVEGARDAYRLIVSGRHGRRDLLVRDDGLILRNSQYAEIVHRTD